MIRFIKQLFCKHSWKWEQNVYGDPINYLNCRSIWKCKKCDAYGYCWKLVR
jgi:hypothetical protein